MSQARAPKTGIQACAWLLSMTVTACSSPATLTDADRELAGRVGFTEEQLLAVKRQGFGLRQLQGWTDGGELFPAAGVTVEVSGSSAPRKVRRLREALGAGHLVFVSERNYGIGGAKDHLSVLAGDDPYQALETMGTNGWNYDVGPDAVMARIREWDERFGLRLQGASFDWLEATFVRQPEDMRAFAREVYEFCPDVVDQGTETVEALAREMRATNTVYLWWD